jgi:hypothetical protein
MNEPKKYKLPTGETIELKRFCFRIYRIENGVITHRRCCACKKFLNISDFVLFKLRGVNRFFPKCILCKRDLDRAYSTTKRRQAGQKPMRYVELLHIRKNGVVGIVCTKCGDFHPLCDYRVRISTVNGKKYKWQTSICNACQRKYVHKHNTGGRRNTKNNRSHPWCAKDTLALNNFEKYGGRYAGT